MKITLYINEEDLDELYDFQESKLGFYHYIKMYNNRENDKQLQISLNYEEYKDLLHYQKN